MSVSNRIRMGLVYWPRRLSRQGFLAWFRLYFNLIYFYFLEHSYKHQRRPGCRMKSKIE